MAKPFKIFLWIVGGLFGLIVVTAVALPLFFNPNNYKGKIEGSVHDSTGREIKINGNIKLTIFPWLGVAVSDVVLGNAQGFGPEPFAQVADARVSVKLMPLLFGKRVEVDTVHIDGFALNLQKAADGQNNWTFNAEGEAEATPEKPEHPEQGTPMAFSVGGLDIQNATFSYTDKQTGAAYKVANLRVETGKVELGEPLDVTIAFLVNSAQPPLESDVKIAFTALADLDKKVYEVKELKVDSTTKGASVPGGSQKASIRANARYDGNAGSFALNDAKLEAAGLEMTANIDGTGLSGQEPKISGKLASNTFNPKDVAKSFGVTLPATTDPKALTQASFAANLGGDTKSAKLEDLVLKLDQTTFKGNVTIRDFATQAIAFMLKGDSFDADRYLAPPTEGDEKTVDPKKKGGDFKETPIPVEMLDALNMTGTIDLASLKAKGLSMTNIHIVIDAPKGPVKTEELTALLYGGKITQSAKFSHASPVHYDMKVGLDAVNSAPLLKDLLGKSYLSGLGNFNLNVSSGGTTVGAFLQALSGAVGTSFKDGAVEGFNLGQTIAGAKAMLAGQAAPATSEPKRTEFRDLKATGKIVNGILDTDTLDVKGSFYQLGGDGKVNLVDQTLDYTLLPTLTGEKFKDLGNAKIPIQVSGSWFAPKVTVDLKGAVKGQVKEQLKQQEDKYREKAKDRLGDFLRKHTQPPPEQKPAEPPKTETAPSTTSEPPKTETAPPTTEQPKQ